MHILNQKVTMKLWRWLFALMLCLPWSVMAGNALPNVAFFYAANLPWSELRAFDVVVVEPQHVPNPAVAPKEVQPFAYVSVGEVAPERAYLKDIPKSWLVSRNQAWGSQVIDQSQAGWPEFFAERVIRPLWRAGYRGFFLDTLDSYHLFAKTDAQRQAQEAGMVRVIRELRKKFPDIRLMFNRGFEILPQVHQEVYAVAAESLYQGWNQAAKKYREVPVNDREWLLQQLLRVQKDYALPVIAIDYVAPKDRELARVTAKKIAAHGFIPWVSTPELDMLGIGNIEVMPRKVLILYNDADNEYELYAELSQRFIHMPLNYMGYRIEFADLRKPLPADVFSGRYAGAVVWLMHEPDDKQLKNLETWLDKLQSEGGKVAFFDQFRFVLNTPLAKKLALKITPSRFSTNQVTIAKQDALMGFEIQPQASLDEFVPMQADNAEVLLQIRNEHGETQDAAAITAWGGYVVVPYAVTNLPMKKGSRWVVQPFEFLRRALRLPEMPIPDMTTESGRRMLIVHMDGDAFVSQAEMPGTPYAGEVLRDRIIKKYKVPTAISVIQGEIAANGLYPAISSRMEAVAREIFAMPHVEIASHSYSHPFFWDKVLEEQQKQDEKLYRLPIPNYKFDLKNEILGSVDYINTRLAPPNKKLKLFLWTGNCNPGVEALAITEQAGLLAMNGGETMNTNMAPSLTLVAPLGLPKRGYFQVFAPNQNENVYTNDWTGPFYGYKRVLETFELTEKPRRLKPINIYYHTYAATKVASLDALETAFNWALSQEITSVFPSEYVLKVHDFNRMVIARSTEGWLIRGMESLRQLRIPKTMGKPDMQRSKQAAGFVDAQEGYYYLHVGAEQAQLVFQAQASHLPYLVSANAHIVQVERPSTQMLRVLLQAYVPLEFRLANSQPCQVSVNGKVVKAHAVHEIYSDYRVNSHEKAELNIRCNA